MKSAGIIGIILIIVGIVALAYGGFARYTTTENVAKLGPLEVNAEKEHRLPMGPIIGGICLVGGIVLVVTGGRGRAT
ncbi:MAG: hypothetical protein QOG48_1925 [Verrucomicrobiota bacterium]|jgi:uncharacterized membrane protein YidH (DUF202 family)